MTDLFDLSGRVAIVTGAPRGLGRAIAGAFTEAGAAVVVVSRKAERASAPSRSWRRRVAYPCHVGRWDELDGLVEFAYAEFGRVDVLVNNAGVSPMYDSLSDVTEALFDKVLDVNLKGPFRLATLVGERMLAAAAARSSTSAARRGPPDAATSCPTPRPKPGERHDGRACARLRAEGARQRDHARPFLTSISAGWDMELSPSGRARSRCAGPATPTRSSAPPCTWRATRRATPPGRS